MGQTHTREFRWGTLEQKRGRPAEEGNILICDITGVRDTGSAVELASKSLRRPIILEFEAPAERQAWGRYLELAWKVLALDSEEATLLGRAARQYKDGTSNGRSSTAEDL